MVEAKEGIKDFANIFSELRYLSQPLTSFLSKVIKIMFSLSNLRNNNVVQLGPSPSQKNKMLVLD